MQRQKRLTLCMLLQRDGCGDAEIEDWVHVRTLPSDFALVIEEMEFPMTDAQAMAGLNAAVWRAAMDADMTSHQKHHTYDLVDKPPGVQSHPSKWVLDLKCNPEGKIEWPKARWVGQGFNQVLGWDYTSTYVPMVRSESPLSSLRDTFFLSST